MSEVVSHNDDVQTQEIPLEDRVSGALELFGVTPSGEKETATNESEEKEIEQEEEVPVIEQPTNVRKVKYNKQEVEVPEEQVDELLQKGLALDKVREKQSEAEKALQRAAKLAGYEKVDDYLKNLDNIEKEAVKQKQDHLTDLRNQLREEAENAGLDPQRVDEWLDNNPLLAEARKVLDREEQEREAIKQRQAEEMNIKGWEALFQKYPTIADEMDEEGQSAPWLTPEMVERIKRGYDPIDAYELVHRDKLVSSEKEKARQDVLKQQRLNKRAAVEGNVTGEPDDGVPDSVKGAFAMFGLDPSQAKKFISKK